VEVIVADKDEIKRKEEEKKAREKAIRGASSRMEGGVKVTSYPAVEDVERPVTARPIGKPIPGEHQKYRAYTEGGGGGGGGSLLHEMNPQRLYKKGGSVKSASARADGCAQRGKTRGKMV
jgi:hypothetical protein